MRLAGAALPAAATSVLQSGGRRPSAAGRMPPAPAAPSHCRRSIDGYGAAARPPVDWPCPSFKARTAINSERLHVASDAGWAAAQAGCLAPHIAGPGHPSRIEAEPLLVIGGLGCSHCVGGTVTVLLHMLLLVPGCHCFCTERPGMTGHAREDCKQKPNRASGRSCKYQKPMTFGLLYYSTLGWTIVDFWVNLFR